MTPKEMADYVRLKTNTDSTVFDDTKMLLLAGVHMDDLAHRIIQADEDHFGMPYTTDLLLNQREYGLPTDMLTAVKHVEAKLDGSKFVNLKEFDLNQYSRPTDEETIISIFSNIEENAYYDLYRGSLWIYSGAISNVIDGLKIWSFSYPKHVTDLTSQVDMSIDPSTTEHGFPKQFHLILAKKIINEWKKKGDKPLNTDETDEWIEAKTQQAIETLRPANRNRLITGQVVNRHMHEGNDGYNF